MTDSNNKNEEPVFVAAAAVGDEYGEVAEAGIAVQGNQALLVARFADRDAAGEAYEALREAEAERSINIQGVLVVDADNGGNIKVRKMTDHHTRNGLKWGAVAGAALAIVFPPSILAGAALGGIIGAAAGKIGNIKAKADVAKELADVVTPGTSGILAVLDLNAVDEVKKSLSEAEEVKAVPVDDETAAAVNEAAKSAAAEAPTT